MLAVILIVFYITKGLMRKSYMLIPGGSCCWAGPGRGWPNCWGPATAPGTDLGIGQGSQKKVIFTYSTRKIPLIKGKKQIK